MQVQISPGLPSFALVGLPDKAVAESRERIRAALTSIGLGLPPKKITVNLSPADLQKEGTHFDLPIILGILVALKALAPEDLHNYFALGELALDGRLTAVSGVLPAALLAASSNKGLICPKYNGPEAAWASGIEILAADSLISLMNHLKGTQVLSPPKPMMPEAVRTDLDLMDIKGQESAKRVLEIAAAGGHNILFQGPPGSGKSMLSSRLPGLLPPLSPEEALEVTMVHSIAGTLTQGKLLRDRPYRDPHHSLSLPAMVGGGIKAKPGEISLAHHGVLFLDELPEFSRATLETLRQPLETNRVTIARANAHITYPANFQLIAAMNPCRCGYLDDPGRACSRVPKCAADYQAKISGPLLDRIDLNLFVSAIKPSDLSICKPCESSKDIALRVQQARSIQYNRYKKLASDQCVTVNANVHGKLLDHVTELDHKGQKLLSDAADRFKLSARGYYRVLKVARTLADLEQCQSIKPHHIAEAIGYRQMAITSEMKVA